MGTRATEARGGVDAGTHLGLEAGLIGETLETDLVEGIGGVTARSRRSGTTVSGWFGSCDRGVSAPALRCRRFPPKKSKRRRGDAGGCSPDELAKEDLLVGVEGLWSSGGRSGARGQRMQSGRGVSEMGTKTASSRGDRAPKSPASAVSENARGAEGRYSR
ncbi:hypothetical protein N9M16_00180 [Candidatus Dependentiae bacterium]|nr:hypothetical protein [Candidatus Dependentiae bacterium]